MRTAGAVIGILGGVLGLGFAAFLVSITTTGLPLQGGPFPVKDVNLTWGAVLASLLAIASGAIAVTRPQAGGIALIVVALLGTVLGGVLVPIWGTNAAGILVACMLLSLVGGAMAVAAGSKSKKPSVSQP